MRRQGSRLNQAVYDGNCGNVRRRYEAFTGGVYRGRYEAFSGLATCAVLMQFLTHMMFADMMFA